MSGIPPIISCLRCNLFGDGEGGDAGGGDNLQIKTESLDKIEQLYSYHNLLVVLHCNIFGVLALY